MNTSYQPVSMEQAMVTRVSKTDLIRWAEESALPYRELTAYYRCAMENVAARLRVAGEEYALHHELSPIEEISTELKSPESILDRILADGLRLNVGEIERHVNDLAAVRVICAFRSDAYALADALLKQDEVTLLQKDDYIAQPKESGYRGLHLLVSVPVVLNGQWRAMKVEVRFLTPAMELWVEAEEKFSRTKDIPVPEQIARDLRDCAQHAAELDERLEQIRYNVEHRVITK